MLCAKPLLQPLNLVYGNHGVNKLLLALMNNPGRPETDLQQVKSYNLHILQAVSASQCINQCAAKISEYSSLNKTTLN